MTKAGQRIVEGLKEAITMKQLMDENERLREEKQKLRDALTYIQCKAHDTLRPIPFQDEE